MTYKNKKELIKSLITPDDTVLDVGFWGQGIPHTHPDWPHLAIKGRAREVYGVDLDFNRNIFSDQTHYFKQNAESIEIPVRFNVIFAGDVIEHFSNPGMFLDSCRKTLKPDGKLIISTPNCFNLFSITEKIMKPEPTVNRDHTCYFNSRTLSQLLARHGFKVVEISFVYGLDALHHESLKKKALNIIYYLISLFTSKFLESLVCFRHRHLAV